MFDDGVMPETVSTEPRKPRGRPVKQFDKVCRRCARRFQTHRPAQRDCNVCRGVEKAPEPVLPVHGPIEPMPERTPEQKLAARRLEDKLRKREQRAREKAKLEALAKGAPETQKEWWATQRAGLKPEQLEDFQARHLRVDTLLTALIYAQKHNLSKEAANDIFQDVLDTGDLVQDIIEFAKANPCPHLGRVCRNPEINGDWPGSPFWTQPELLKMLYAEGPATEAYVRFGYLIGVPDWQVERFLNDYAGWSWEEAGKFVGYRIDQSGRVKY